MTEAQLAEIVFQGLGEVSMCWSETPKGVFDSKNAARVGNEIMQAIKQSKANQITLSLDFFEHLLNCLANQKYIHELPTGIELENQKIIDKAWNDGMNMLSEAQHKDDNA